MRLRVPWLFWVAAAVFVLLTALVATDTVDGFDRRVLDICLRHYHPTAANAARHLTDVLSPPVDAAILSVGAAALAWVRRRLRPFLVAAVTGWATAAIVWFTKDWVGRPLPHSPVAPEHGGGFPSGHTATFLVCFGVLALITTRPGESARRLALAAVAVGTCVIAAALVYDGFHWFTDTLGSMALGVAVLSALARYLTAARPAPPRDDGA